MYLAPKVPKKDFKSILENTGLNLRFLAEFVDPAPEDITRRFIITYYMSDATISIFERFEKNSGFIGGKFLERGRIKNPATGEFYTQGDLVVGTAILLNTFNFRILDCDKFTQKFIESNPTYFPDTVLSAPNNNPEIGF